LRGVAEHDDRLSVSQLDTLILRADQQSGELELIRREIAAKVLTAG
jgi:hypothetical protein